MANYEEEYVFINGIEHYLLHYPKAADTPILLYLHGGLGNFESSLAYQLDEVWGDMFTHVHWDQRGAGKTFRRNKKKGMPETVEQMLADLHGIIGHLQQKYHTEKIVILGHSWGSVLGSLYGLRHPEHVLSYIGVGQVINMKKNEQTAYEETLEMARKAGNQKHLQALEKLENYPPDDPELLLKLLPKLRKIQAAYDGPISGSGLWGMINVMRYSPIFQWRDLIGFVKMMKVNRPLLLELLSFDLNEYPPYYTIPVHYILGEMDTITPISVSRAYFDTMEAPDKTITIIANAGHNCVYEQPEEFATALRSVRELL